MFSLYILYVGFLVYLVFNISLQILDTDLMSST